MKAALITIGNELLSGFTVNTNAAWIGQEMGNIGIELRVQHTIGDDKEHIITALEDVSKDMSVVVVTGGLGPTHDDVTPSAFYSYFEDKPVFDEQYWKELTERFSRINYSIPDLNRNQAMKPEKGEVIQNMLGSARGLQFKKGSCHYFALPGVPKEMKAMMMSTVLPFLKSLEEKPISVRTIRTTGIPESALAEKINKKIISHNFPCSVAFLPKLTGVDIRLFGQDAQNIRDMEEILTPVIEKYVYGYDDVSLEEVVGNRLRELGLTLATAESCTGGLLGHRITSVSGSSDYYLGGVVSYNNEAKMELLGVKKQTLEKFGAVSEETVREMAQGVRSLFKSDLGISISGIAGPTGGTPEKPVGLIYIGLSSGKEVAVKKFNFFRDRDSNKRISSQVALNMIRLALKNE
ncbi:MAG TPA: competence/damage-inducible protein A [Candidatus Marinimicrobia bacterium]|jgi:nicotinamide-nucleotide amidase|nr:competence/damage-inducible protein A [Candidatus Neomarinimicrobiota bacterium]MDP6143059.1 competence/damage-inducible protein A [Candidatus Neomarinimicrobiota bacterium]MDP6262046.1 competence/damage-inducible protein A [Candidatus Neomarinimicrobiota bacterium]MDP7128170.1 competence/damage-inducible protein A [Candidatus Neomarinimicrobiota bacterium]MDP7337146.1 competence/damage-inducible protein A [Candidatus Neomarinimicrobiota bacterium]|tara:strand:- start:9711 stop:10931 length:1221 start_codon:yes stop_codon:yes gene_type:complete